MKTSTSCCRTLAVAVLALMSFAAAPRATVPFNDGWLFEGRGANGRAVRSAVTLPHTWNAADALLGIDYVRGVGKYTKLFTPDPVWQGRRVFVHFEGANTVAEVFVNGTRLGEHRGGYSAFAFEITPHLQFGRENQLVVQVDNSAKPDVIPLGGDFNIYGGLHRPVELIVTGPVCIDPLDYASPGVYLKQKEVSSAHASVEVATLVSNAGAAARGEVDVAILDEAGATAAQATTPVEAATGRSTVSTSVAIPTPRLWNGRRDPYLYRARVRVVVGGHVVDEVEQPLGLRSFLVDPEQGLVLNGVRVKAHGVSRHQDWSGKGSALSEADHERDLALILEMGANAVRLAHYQHADYFLDLCDRSGLVAWAEIPFVGSLGPGFADNAGFKANVRQQFTELVRQQYNHPSILFWGLSNELAAGSGETRPDPLLKELQAIAHAEDPGRLTAQASIAFNDVNAPLNLIPDVIGFNEYFGWYFGQPSHLGPWADAQHRAQPRRALAVTEYGAGGNVAQHESDPRRPFPMFHPWHPEEYQLLVHEQNWRAIADRPFIWGSFVWNMFDFGSNFRREGPIDAINDKGLVTYDRAIKKDAFYFYKANWNPDPMVYLTSRRYVIRREAVTPIKVYTNLGSVELKVNGVSLGRRSPDSYRVAEWPGVVLRTGNNVIAVSASDTSGRIVEDGAVWIYDGKPWVAAVAALFRWLIKPLFVLSVVKLLALYYLSFRMALSSRKWRLFWRVCFTLAVVWCAALVVFYGVAAHYGFGVFDYSQI
jgi:beta-galactosidase